MVSFSRRGRRWPQGSGAVGGASGVTPGGRGQLMLAGPAPQVLFSQARSGGLQLVGHAPIAQMTSVTTGLGALTLTGPAPSINYEITPGRGQLTLTSFAPNIGDILKPLPASLTIGGPAPVAVSDQLAVPGAAALSLTGPAPTVDAGGSGGPTSLSTFGTANGLGETLTLPANIAEGDLILSYERSAGFEDPGTAAPSGFTVISTLTDGLQASASLTYKIAVGNEGGTAIAGLVGGAGNDHARTAIVVRGDNPITAVNVVDVDAALQNSQPSAQVALASGGTQPLVVVGAFSASGTIADETFDPAPDTTATTSNTRMHLKTKYYNSTPADVDIAMLDEGSQNSLISCYIECN